MNVAPAPVISATTRSPDSAGAAVPSALGSPVAACSPPGWQAATNSRVDRASTVVRKIDVFMGAPVVWRWRACLGCRHEMMFLLHDDDSAAGIGAGTQRPAKKAGPKAREQRREDIGWRRIPAPCSGQYAMFCDQYASIC